MAQIQKGRLCADNDRDIVVFLIGARVNKWWLLPLSLPILSRMRSMQRELLNDPTSGLLGIQSMGFADVQYWRSIEDLLRYAEAREKHHKPTAKKFYQKLFRNEAVGVWHETYFVSKGHYESLYLNMTAQGLGKFSVLSEASGVKANSRGRMEVYFQERALASEGASERLSA